MLSAARFSQAPFQDTGFDSRAINQGNRGHTCNDILDQSILIDIERDASRSDGERAVDMNGVDYDWQQHEREMQRPMTVANKFPIKCNLIKWSPTPDTKRADFSEKWQIWMLYQVKIRAVVCWW
jgi:hypothetical protein